MRRRSRSWLGGLLAPVLVVACVGCRSEPEAPASRPAQASPVQDQAGPRPQPRASAAPPAAPVQQPPGPARPDGPRGFSGPLPPLPNVPYPPARSIEITRAVYAFAARNPEVLRYVPCFCGCEHHGHQGNEDCFVAGREADGTPRWEMHGYV